MKLNWIEQTTYSTSILINGLVAGTHVAEPSSGLLATGALSRAANGFRFVCRQGEAPNFDGQGKDRCELVFPQAYARLVPVYDSEQIVVEPGSLSTADWCILSQWHCVPDAGDISPSPELALQLDTSDHLVINTRGSAAHPIVSNPAGTDRWVSPVSIVRGRAINIQTEAIFDYAGAGALKVTIDGAVVLNLTNISMGYNVQGGTYRKCGVYRSSSPETLAVQHWNMETRTGSSFSSRSTAPCIVAQ